jgi:hypothetical protein
MYFWQLRSFFSLKGLGPGQSLSSSLWIRGPEQLGVHSITIYFYYEAPPLSEGSRIHHYRMLKSSFTLKVIPSMSISALRSRPCLHDNNLCQTVLVAVNNACATVTQQVNDLTESLSIQIYVNNFTRHFKAQLRCHKHRCQSKSC